MKQIFKGISIILFVIFILMSAILFIKLIEKTEITIYYTYSLLVIAGLTTIFYLFYKILEEDQEFTNNDILDVDNFYYKKKEEIEEFDYTLDNEIK